MATHTFILNGKQVSVDCADDVRLLWVLRDLLGIHGPKYGCGLDVCKACTCHINGKAFNPCSVQVRTSRRATRSRRSRGCQRTWARSTRCSRRGSTYDVGAVRLLPAGPDHDRGGARQGGEGEGHEIADADLDEIRNICRCGTYHRIREAIVEAAADM